MFCEIFLLRHGATIADSSLVTLADRLAHSRRRFGSWTLAELEDASADLAAWRAEYDDAQRYRVTSAMRQALAAVMRWKYLDRNPAVDAGKNTQPRAEEIFPFTPDEVDMIAAELDQLDAARMIVAGETGLPRARKRARHEPQRLPYELIAAELAARREGASLRECAEAMDRSPTWVSFLLRWHAKRYGSVRCGITCNGCGETFEAARADARYCSNGCRQRAYRQRQPKAA